MSAVPACVEMSMEVWNQVSAMLVWMPFAVMAVMCVANRWEWWVDRFRIHRRRRRLARIRAGHACAYCGDSRDPNDICDDCFPRPGACA